jgi:hypothetical protein
MLLAQICVEPQQRSQKMALHCIREQGIESELGCTYDAGLVISLTHHHSFANRVCAQAVQGRPFVFDPRSVQFALTGQDTGAVHYKGRPGAAAPDFVVSMEACVSAAATRHAPHAGAAATHAQHRRTPHASVSAPGAKRIRVRAKRHAPSVQSASAAAGGPSESSGTGPATVLTAQHVSEADIDAEAAVVSAALDQLFNGLKLNLQGVELSRPALRLVKPAPATAPHPLLLEISMELHLRELPPLNMSF